MHNTVRKKKNNIALWDMGVSDGANMNNARKGRSHNVQSINRAQSQNIQIIGAGGREYYDADKARIIERRKARRRRAYLYRALAFAMLASSFVLICLVMGFIYKFMNKEDIQETIALKKTPIVKDVDEIKIEEPDIMVDLLEVNDYSRPATELDNIKSIFVHYTANPGTSAKQNRSYFANLGETHERSASAHFIIGYEGEIIQCIPLEEQAYAVMTRNDNSISIECCYLDKDGEFTQETYDSLVHLLAWLKQEYNLESEDILRHYDCGGKLCPLYYVENEDEWTRLLRDVEKYQD